MEHEVLKQDSKMNLLSDKVMDMKMEFTLSGNQYIYIDVRQGKIVQINMKMRKNKQTILIYLPVHQLAMFSLNQIIIIELMKSQ